MAVCQARVCSVVCAAAVSRGVAVCCVGCWICPGVTRALSVHRADGPSRSNQHLIQSTIPTSREYRSPGGSGAQPAHFAEQFECASALRIGVVRLRV